MLFTDIDVEDLLELPDPLVQGLFKRAYTSSDRLQNQYYTEENQYPLEK